jgi:hypothetical protein
MNSFENLIRVVLWLAKRDWGLSFLLAFTSFIVFVGLAAQRPDGALEALWEGPVFGAGVYVGALFFPSYATYHASGFYLVPLLGVAANFLVLLAFWFGVVRAVRRFRAKKQDTNIQQPEQR